MRSLALLLHFYQPPTQSGSITEQVLRSCYLPLADLLLAHPEANFTLNISGSLLEDLGLISDHAFTEKIKILLGRHQVELSNSLVYHPLLPLIAADEVTTHLEINRELLRDTFQTEPVKVFYPPELAIKPENLAQIPQDNRILVDESSVDPDFDLNQIPQHQVFGNLVTSSRAVTEILRSYPTTLTGTMILKFLEAKTSVNQTIVCTSDAEVFGHHYSERINLLKELLESRKIKFIKITDVSNGATADRKLKIVASSWQTSREDLKNVNPFPVWLSPTNILQNKYDDLAKLTGHLLKKSPDTNLPAERHYYRGISSCHYYWLSNWPWWHPDLVETGTRELIRAVRSLFIDSSEKLPAEKLYHDFLMSMWSYHWSGQVEKNYQKYNLYRQKMLEQLPKL